MCVSLFRSFSPRCSRCAPSPTIPSYNACQALQSNTLFSLDSGAQNACMGRRFQMCACRASVRVPMLTWRALCLRLSSRNPVAFGTGPKLPHERHNASRRKGPCLWSVRPSHFSLSLFLSNARQQSLSDKWLITHKLRPSFHQSKVPLAGRGIFTPSFRGSVGS